MDNTNIINVLNTCFLISLAFAILFFIISIVLFFVFDIKTIVSIKTGRAQAKTISEMKKANASTGRLRVDGKTVTSKLSDEDKNKMRAPAVTPPPQPNVKQYDLDSSKTDVLKPSSDTAETSVLGHTDKVSANNYASDNQIPNINFKVVKHNVYIHTDVIID